jgi:hypothetical protein
MFSVRQALDQPAPFSSWMVAKKTKSRVNRAWLFGHILKKVLSTDVVAAEACLMETV